MKAKIIYDMSNEEYHSSPAISKSALDEFAKSPLHYWDRYINPDKPTRKPTEAMLIGSALHTLVLEPHKFEAEYAVYPEFDKRTKLGKEEFIVWQHDNEGKIHISKEAYTDCQRMVDAIGKHPVARTLLDGSGKAETSIFWRYHKNLPIDCRCRPDYITPSGIIVDLKTSLTASENGFKWKAYDMRYHVQAAFYGQGFKAAFGAFPEDFMFVAVEKTAPYLVSVQRATKEFIAEGHMEMEENLRGIAQCRVSGVYPGYNNDEVIELKPARTRVVA